MERFPDWAFTRGFDGRGALMRGPFEIVLTFEGLPSRAHWVRVWQDALQLLRAGAQPCEPKVSRDEALAWLTSALEPGMPSWKFGLVVRAPAEVSPAEARLLARDVFKDVAFEQRLFVEDAEVELPAEAQVLLRQGVPPLVPTAALLGALGMEELYPQPEAQWPREGALIGAVRATSSASTGQRRQEVRLPASLRLQHTMIVGGSGTGKSTLIARMIEEDLHAPERPGIVLIDPHGSLVEQVLTLIPRERAAEITLIDVERLEGMPTWNPWAAGAECVEERARLAGQYVALCDGLFEEGPSSGPVTRSHLTNLARVVMGFGEAPPIPTLRRCLEDEDYLDYVLAKTKDREAAQPIARAKEDGCGEQRWSNWMPYLNSRITPLTAHPVVQRLFGVRRGSFEPLQAVQNGGIVLVNLSRSVLPERTIRVVGTMLVEAIFDACVATARLRGGRAVQLYLDEFQNFASARMPVMFAEGRKFGLGVTVASQNLFQWQAATKDQAVVDSVLSNTATKFLFRVNPRDSVPLSDYTKPAFDDVALARTPNRQCVFVMQGEWVVPPVRLNTFAPDGADVARGKALRAEVEIRQHAERVAADAPSSAEPVVESASRRSNDEDEEEPEETADDEEEPESEEERYARWAKLFEAIGDELSARRMREKLAALRAD
ncbi:MAG: type IV secretion system DNA-binding domain-containing protein [Casimicrobiaceae bacterium]|nr:type IV secretion system DNA-binding domain-containing protein [Casimicrobiaceae bacterium]